MTRKIKLITLIDLIFIFLLGLSGSVQDKLGSELLYYLAFAAPIAIGTAYATAEAKESGASGTDVIKDVLGDFTLKWDKALSAIPVTVIGIAVTALISLATGELMELFGKENVTVFDEPFALALLLHALLPAMLEELLFRFVPIRLLGSTPKTALILSSLLFAFAHANLFQIPYAFAAGLILAFLYITTESIIPCIVMHFLNNSLSLASIYGYLSPTVWIVFSVLALAAICVTVLRRKHYARALKQLCSDEKPELGIAPIVFICLSLILAISALFA